MSLYVMDLQMEYLKFLWIEFSNWKHLTGQDLEDLSEAKSQEQIRNMILEEVSSFLGRWQLVD